MLWHVCRKPEFSNHHRQPLLGNGSANTSIARLQRPKQTNAVRQWLSKRHVNRGHAYVRNNRRTIGSGVFYAVRRKDYVTLQHSSLQEKVFSVGTAPRLYDEI
jgi:hypothetical protein